ncbi:MAG: hypothetical protein ACUVXD_16030, partial [Thermodesulfobacteriota bacterium]
LEEMWERLLAASQHLGMDYLEMKVFDGKHPLTRRHGCLWEAGNQGEVPEPLDPEETVYVSLPLGQGERNLGLLRLAKDISEAPLPRHALRRIGQLRRTVTDTLIKLQKEGVLEAPGHGARGERLDTQSRS